jgi:hypothetical protein
MNKPHSGSHFKSNAMSFGAGALGGVAAYSLMRSMSSSYHSGSGYYQAGYGTGETCTNTEDMNGTRYDNFRCPLNGFPYEAKYCCGDSGKQYCCIRERPSGMMRSGWNFGWIILLVIIVTIVAFIFARRRQRRQKDIMMVPKDVPVDEQQQPFSYNPPPPPMGYPPPPMGYQPPPMGFQPPPNGNPYEYPPQNYDGNFNPYSQQNQMSYQSQQQMSYPPQQPMAYPPQQQMAYPPQQQPSNPYLVKENNPPTYDDAIYNMKGASTTKPI